MLDKGNMSNNSHHSQIKNAKGKNNKTNSPLQDNGIRHTHNNNIVSEQEKSESSIDWFGVFFIGIIIIALLAFAISILIAVSSSISQCSSPKQEQPIKNVSTEQQYSLPQKPTIVNEFDVEAAEYRLYRLDDEMTYHGMKTLHVIVRSDNRITADGMRVSPTSNSSIGRKYDFQCGNSNFAYFFNSNQLTIK